MKRTHFATGMLAIAMLSGCMATDPSLAPKASFSADMASSGDLTMSLPATVSVLPTPSGHAATQVALDEPADLASSSFTGPQPSGAARSGAFQPVPPGEPAKASVVPQPDAPAAKAVEPQPAVLVAGPFPAAPAALVPPSGEKVFLEPLPASFSPRTRPFQLPAVEGGSDEVNRLIEKYAKLYDVPVNLVRRVVRRESTFNPAAYNNGHWGLMQIKHATARGMGYQGPARGLLDAETNLKYAVRYLRGAWMVAAGNPDLADRLYQSGYYYHAKRQGLLDETGLGRDRVRKRRLKRQEMDDPPPGMGLL